LAAGFCSKNLAFARKIMVLPESGGLQPPALARTHVTLILSCTVSEKRRLIGSFNALTRRKPFQICG